MSPQLQSPLLILALVLLLGILGGELAGRIRLPKVTGWIGTGILLRAVGITGGGDTDISQFSPFTNFVLGFIAFTVGATLHAASLRNAKKRLLVLLVAEALVLPMIVVPLLIYVGGLDVPLAMLLGAIAVAGAPGTTVIVVREARARGILSRTLIAAVGLIDMVAVGVFVFVTSLLATEAGGFGGINETLTAVGTAFGLAASIGLGCAVVVIVLVRTVVGPAFVGPMMVAAILGSWGLGQALGASSILTCTFTGIAMSNLRHETARSAEAYLHPFGGVLFAGFYTLAGMRLDFSMVIPMASLVGLYFGARLLGKSASAYLAMKFSGAPERVGRYLGLALLPHGGVAVGLIFLVQEDPALASMGDAVATIGLATLAINQLIGPSATRFALARAGEVGMDRPRLLDFLSEQRIVVGLHATSKRELVELLAERLYGTSDVPMPKEEFIEAVLAREADESTCLGKGLMVPHAMLPEGENVKGVLGLSSEGLDFDAFDREPIRAVLLLATPENSRDRHLEILAAFASAITRDGNLRSQLYAAHSPAHAYDVLHADEAQDLNYFLDDAIREAATDRDPSP